MIIDGHAHISDTDYGNVDKLIEIYNDLGIDRGLIVPGGMLDVRIMTKYVTGTLTPTNVIPPNELIKSALEKYPDRFWGFYCVNPSGGQTVLSEFEDAIRNGFSGLKLSPMNHQFSLSSSVVKELAKLCGELNVPFYTHVLFSPAANSKKIYMLAKEFAETNFIIGHMGFGPSDAEAFEYAKEMKNIYLETSTANVLALSEAIKIAGAEKLIFGSEYPLSHPYVEMKKLEVLKLSDKEVELITSKNIINLLHVQKGE